MLGVLSALPIVAVGNICCCLWVVSGGAVAAYALQQRQPARVTPGEGALVGLLAGLIGTFIYVLLSVPINLLMAPFERQLVERLVTFGNMPPEFRDYVNRPAGLRAVGILLDFVIRIFRRRDFRDPGRPAGRHCLRKEAAGDGDRHHPGLVLSLPARGAGQECPRVRCQAGDDSVLAGPEAGHR